MIIEQIEVTMMSVFCYVIGDEVSGEAVLVDPAGDFRKIESCIKKNGLSVRAIVNTHGHFDHVSGNAFFARKTGASVYIHSGDIHMLSGRLGRVMSLFRGGWGRLPEPVPLKDGDIIEAGTLKLLVIHTPGHSPGSICLKCGDNLFTGDTLFTEGTGRTDFAGGSQEQLMASLRERVFSLPDNTVIWPGHNYGRFPVSTVREQKKIYLP